MDKLKKEHLQNVLEGWQVSTEGTVQQLRDRMNDIIKKRTSEHQKAKHDTKKVFLSQDVGMMQHDRIYHRKCQRHRATFLHN